MSITERTITDVAGDHPGVNILAASFAALASNPAANTKITYIYRDGNNYKTDGQTIFGGAISPADIDKIMSHLDEDGGFIPGQVGMADLQIQMAGGWNDDSDHPFHEITAIELTGEPADNVAIDKLVRLFSEVSWDQDHRPSNG